MWIKPGTCTSPIPRATGKCSARETALPEQPLHHQPTRGGESERGKFEDWYARTLKSYQAVFGEAAPSDIWPSPETRHAEKHLFVRVDRERNWVIPKPRLQLNTKVATTIGLAGILVFGSAATLAKGGNVFDWRGPDFLGFYAILFSACFLLALWLRRTLRVPAIGKASEIAEVDGYASAFLNGGKVLALNTAIANLINQNALRFDKETHRIASRDLEAPLANDLERVVYSASQGGAKIADVREAAKPFVSRIADDLQMRGLVVADKAARKAIAFPLVLAIAAVCIGVCKIIIGVERGKPVGFLVALCFISLIISLVAFARRPLRSQYGDAVLRKLQARHAGSRKLGPDVSGVGGAEFATIVGLFGLTALAGSDLADLHKTLRPNPANGSGCGSSCGGGCGGGCGGCGGCGGD